MERLVAKNPIVYKVSHRHSHVTGLVFDADFDVAMTGLQPTLRQLLSCWSRGQTSSLCSFGTTYSINLSYQK